MAFKFRKVVKKVGRLHAKVFSKTVKGFAPILSAAATVYGGPAAGAGVTLALAGASRYAGAAALRGKHLSKQAINAKARSLRKQVLKYGLLGTGAGALTAAIAGGSVLSALTGLGSQTFSKFGLGGGGPDRGVRDFSQYDPELHPETGGPIGTMQYNDPELEGAPGQPGSNTPSWLKSAGSFAGDVGKSAGAKLIQRFTDPTRGGTKDVNAQDGELQKFLDNLTGGELSNLIQRAGLGGGAESGAPEGQTEGLDPIIKWGLWGVAGYVVYRVAFKKAG